jgi:hypothetical protein
MKSSKGAIMFTAKSFSLTDLEYNQIKDWAEKHDCKCRVGDRPSRSCCGGEISVIFTPTSIGTAISAKCVCGKELELDNL